MNCKRCEKEFEQNAKNSRQYCSLKCRNGQNVRNHRQRLKLKAIEYKGGSCQECGYKKSVRGLTFHHLDPNEKDFGIGGRGETRSWKSVKKELDKCVLLCANCHAEEHERLDKEE